MDDLTGLTAASAAPSAPEPGRNAERLLARLELPDAANELLAMVRFLTAPDGPVRQFADTGLASPWHERVLLKAQERIEDLDRFLRGRVAFFVAGRSQGYGAFDEELEVAGAALDTCRAVATVVDELLAGGLPTEGQVKVLGATAMRIYPALDRL